RRAGAGGAGLAADQALVADRHFERTHEEADELMNSLLQRNQRVEGPDSLPVAYTLFLQAQPAGEIRAEEHAAELYERSLSLCEPSWQARLVLIRQCRRRICSSFRSTRTLRLSRPNSVCRRLPPWQDGLSL